MSKSNFTEKTLLELDKENWHLNHNLMGVNRGCNCEIEYDCYENLKSYISNILEAQKTDIKKVMIELIYDIPINPDQNPDYIRDLIIEKIENI
jgi:hypothetical protein